MHATKQVLATAFTAVIASAGLVAATDVAAHADNTAVSIEKQATRSASHKILYVRATVVCSEDTTSAGLSAYVEQTNPAGGTQHAWSAVLSLNAFECTGDEQIVTIPIRRPTGGYAWQAGTAAVRHVVLTTQDPSGTYCAFLKARTVNVR